MAKQKTFMRHVRFIHVVFAMLSIYALFLTVSLLRNPTSFSSTSELKDANNMGSYGPPDEAKNAYTSFHIKYPKNYFVSSPFLLESYVSQGGGGFPSLILTDGYQPSGASLENPDWSSPIYNSGKNCIFITADTAVALPLIDNTPNSTNGITVEKTEKLTINPWHTLLRTITYKREENGPAIPAYQAVIQFPQNVTSTFDTCNRKNKDDLLTVLKYFDVRGTDR